MLTKKRTLPNSHQRHARPRTLIKIASGCRHRRSTYHKRGAAIVAVASAALTLALGLAVGLRRRN